MNFLCHWLFNKTHRLNIMEKLNELLLSWGEANIQKKNRCYFKEGERFSKQKYSYFSHHWLDICLKLWPQCFFSLSIWHKITFFFFSLPSDHMFCISLNNYSIIQFKQLMQANWTHSVFQLNSSYKRLKHISILYPYEWLPAAIIGWSYIIIKNKYTPSMRLINSNWK